MLTPTTEQHQQHLEAPSRPSIWDASAVGMVAGPDLGGAVDGAPEATDKERWDSLGFGGDAGGGDGVAIVGVMPVAPAPAEGDVVVTLTEPGPLGVSFAGTWPTIHSVIPGTQACQHPQLQPGMRLVRIQGRSVDGLTLQQGGALLKQAARPLWLTVRHPTSVAPQPFLVPVPVAGAPVPAEGDVVVTLTEPGPLGVSFAGTWPAIHSVLLDTQACQHPQLQPGMRLVRIQGQSVDGLTLQQGGALLKQAARPLSLTVRPPTAVAPQPFLVPAPVAGACACTLHPCLPCINLDPSNVSPVIIRHHTVWNHHLNLCVTRCAGVGVVGCRAAALLSPAEQLEASFPSPSLRMTTPVRIDSPPPTPGVDEDGGGGGNHLTRSRSLSSTGAGVAGATF
jgi:hypothetical protein